MSGTHSRGTGISDPGYIKDVAEKPRLDTLWAKPRTKEVPMMATEGLLGVRRGCCRRVIWWRRRGWGRGCRPLTTGNTGGRWSPSGWRQCFIGPHRKWRWNTFSKRLRTDRVTGLHKSGFLSAICYWDKASIVAVFRHSSQKRFGYWGDVTFQVSKITRNTWYGTVTFLLRIHIAIFIIR